MFKTALTSFAIITAISLSTLPAMAQLDWGNTSQRTWQQADPLSTGGQANAGLGQTFKTSTQGAGSPGGPNLAGDSSMSGGQDSGAANSAPRMGSKEAPTNLDLMYQTRFGNSLPPTRLDGFIKANMDDHKYGDEGTDQPPPYTNFDYLDSGATFSPDMTTDHKSGLPSSWDTPQ